MLFYPTRRTSSPSCRRGASRPFATAEAGDALHLTWMLKSFATGLALLGLSYWLVQVAGVQYLASLTSATLLAFLLVYVVWCLLHRNRHASQTSDGSSRVETGHNSPIVAPTCPLRSTPPPPFDQRQAYKYVTRAPGRDLSPPPTYEEAIRAMMSTTNCTPVLAYGLPVSPDAVPQTPQEPSANLVPSIPVVSVPPSVSSTGQLSLSALRSSPQRALPYSLSSPSAFTSGSAPALQTQTELPATALTQTSPTALTAPSTALRIQSQNPTPHRRDVS